MGGAGKGDKVRPVKDKAKWDSNFEAIFGRRELKTWKDAGMRVETYTPSERSLFLSWIGEEDSNGCRMWTGAERRGRGRFRTPGRDMLAHRAAAELSGMDIKGMDVTRTCGNTLCCETSHFELKKACERECVVTPWHSILSNLLGTAERATGMGSLDYADQKFVEIVKDCESVAMAATKAKLSVEMTRYTARRIVTRSRALNIRLRGLKVLKANMRSARNILTNAQIDTLFLVLKGMSQADAAEKLGVIQASVSSRVALAKNALRSNLGEAWAMRLYRSILVMRKVVNVRGRQTKPESWYKSK